CESRLLKKIRSRDKDSEAGGQEAPNSRFEARQIEKTYRALRKGAEDLRNTTGSADFYYGEMEMRRRDSQSSWERALLFAYWLLAGYSLRASRAIGALV